MSVINKLPIVVTLIFGGHVNFALGGIPCLNFAGISCNPDLIGFYLYPNSANLTDFDELISGDPQSLAESRYDSSKHLILLTHGFTEDYLSQFPVVVKDAYLNNGFAPTTNIVVVNWGNLSGAAAPTFDIPLAQYIAELPQYLAATQNVKVVGQTIADFLLFLVTNGAVSADRVHLIGQSLGAHVSGFAGTLFEGSTNQLLSRITGTDPAGPLFYPYPLVPLIDPTVASFVDIVHTNRGVFGYPSNLGQVDFNVNGGGPYQPGCTNLTDLFCAHNLAPVYYAQSIINPNLQASEVCLLCLVSRRRVIFGEFCPPGTTGLYNIDLNP